MPTVSPSEVIYVFIGLVVLGLLGFEAYKYIKSHPQVITNLESRLSAAESSIKSTATSDLTALHAKLDALATQLSMVHTAVQNPTQVVVTAAQLPPPVVAASPAPPTPIVPPPPAVQTVVVQVPIDSMTFHSNYQTAYPVGTVFVSQNGNPLSSTGQEIIPAK